MVFGSKISNTKVAAYLSCISAVLRILLTVSKLLVGLSNKSLASAIGTQEITDDKKYDVPKPLDATNQKLCPKCRKGRLLPRVSKFGPWMVCEHTNKGFCDYKQNGHNG